MRIGASLIINISATNFYFELISGLESKTMQKRKILSACSTNIFFSIFPHLGLNKP